MSNLKLPDMSYSNLLRLTEQTGEKWTKVCYETYLKRDSESNHVVKVRHHNTVIANVGSVRTVVDTHGWHSKTTAMRLNAILYANAKRHVGYRKDYIRVLDENTLKGEYILEGETIFYNV